MESSTVIEVSIIGEPFAGRKSSSIFPRFSFRCAVRAALRERDTAFASGDQAVVKTARYELRRTIRDTKRDYRVRLEGQLSNNDPRSLWQGLHTITDFKKKPSTAVDDATLPDKLNNFFGCFEVNDSTPARAPTSADTSSALVLTEDEVRKEFMRVNPRKAAGPDEIPGRVIKLELLASVSGCGNELERESEQRA
ncbi:hypothetical protein AAFF_G00326610 [Aldrovandia affinis]|uniref:Uncharacterized protein n=1 Tax=Aldrovandia affinis TaxID=143900 RepID=A0AAD7T9S7_9TELE|nr:hypothetical protein AAFF_G00326610 [Aldrovandia affinis]